MNSKEVVSKAVKKAKYPQQDASELKAMAAWYGERYSQVWFLRCLNCKRVIGVEAAPPLGGEMVTDRGRAFFTYQDLCLSVRQRLDNNDKGEKMMGYECVCGNRTTLAEVERGEVATRTVMVSKLSGKIADGGKPLPASSPFEMAQAETTIRLKQAQAGGADYELNDTTERFDSFQLERVK